MLAFPSSPQSMYDLVVTKQQAHEAAKLLASVALEEGRVLLFDFVEGDRDALVDALRPLLEDSLRTKVMHDCRQDSDALYHQLGITLRNVFDVQVADAVRKRQRFDSHPNRQGRAFVEPFPTGFRKLVEKMIPNLPPHTEKTLVKEWMENTPDLWARRPMAKELLMYACFDVQHLIPLYSIFAEQIQADYLPMVLDRSEARLDEYRANARGPEQFREKMEAHYFYKPRPPHS